jgi:DNA-binding NarL/FixJ family response regulator
MPYCVQGETETSSGDDRSDDVTRRVLIVDDSKALRDALRRLLADLPEWEICGEASNGREGVEKALELRPDVILMDVGMPELDGLEATRRIRKQLDTEVLVFTQYDSRQAAEEAVEAGARGYLPKSRASDLVEALTAVVQHRSYFGQERAADSSCC